MPPHSVRWLALATLLALPGCFRNTQKSADREVYRALDARRPRVPEARGSLDVEAADARARPARDVREVRLDLAEALKLGALASREYLSRREDVYLKALAFTGTKHGFETTHALGALASSADGPDSGSVAASPFGSISRAFETGGSIVFRLATDFLKSFWGDPLSTAKTILSADLLLPLGRGAGADVAREALTQAERDMLYELRSYARFQQTFAVGIATSFYRVVEAQQTIENEQSSHKSLEQVFARAKDYGPDGAGRLPDFEVDRARQDLLQADERRVVAEQQFEAALDRLKSDLGIPMGAKVTIAAGALDALTLDAPRMNLLEAVATARSRRLELKNSRDQREDAERKVRVAARALGADVTLTLGADLVGPDTRPYDASSAKPAGRTGLDVDLPLDRVAERNDLRSARIEAHRARRAVEGLDDQVTSEVRAAWRALEQAKESYAIQKEGLRLAERRVESANLNLQAGNATTRDVLDAEDDRIRAANALTSARVGYTIAKLEFESAAGTLSPSEVAAAVSPPPPPPAVPPAGAVPAAPAAPASPMPK